MKSHFQFSIQERNGIFLLLLLIVVVQFIVWFYQPTTPLPEVEDNKLRNFRAEVDSLKAVTLEENKPKLYPFNPNFITDYKGYTLGMSNEEIDRLHNFRDDGKWINSKEQFQKITQVSDSLLEAISPYFKFPEWVKQSKASSVRRTGTFISDKEPSYEEKFDLNKATKTQLQSVNGVGEVLSKRILKYRSQIPGGFHSDIELTEIYGLTPEVIERITDVFTVKTPREIQKINLNTATRDELVRIKYIDYEIAKALIEARTLRDGFSTFEELTKVEHFPINKIEIIKLYLHL